MSCPDITVEAYLQNWRRQGFTAPAAIAHLFREIREGHIVPPFPDGTHLFVMDGRFFVEAAYGPPALATSYICRVRTRAERIDFLNARDRPPWSTRPVASPDPLPAPEPEPKPEPVVTEPKPRKPGGGRRRALTQEQIDAGITLLEGQAKMTVDAARATLRAAGIEASDTVLYDLIIKHVHANEGS